MKGYDDQYVTPSDLLKLVPLSVAFVALLTFIWSLPDVIIR